MKIQCTGFFKMATTKYQKHLISLKEGHIYSQSRQGSSLKILDMNQPLSCSFCIAAFFKDGPQQYQKQHISFI